MTVATGTKLGPYEVVGALGAGGMGEVYRARDTRLGRDVAIKILPEHLTEKPEARQRFEREARAISSLQHPNICTLHDIGHQDGTDFLVMELLEGETLAKRLEKGAIPTTELLRIGIEVSDGLEKAHRKGILHRDLKPSNIMLTKSGAKLMDFGLAKAAGDGAVPVLESLTQSIAPSARTTPVTAQGTIVGTFQYMAPEQMEGKEADARSDIFSLGAVLYEMATGRRAFEGKTTASVIAAILEREPPAISSVQPMSPPALDRTVKICLAKDADERFQSAHDVKLQLEWIREAGSQAGVPAPVVAHRKNRERIAWAAAALFAIVAIALAYGFVARAPQPAAAVVSEISPPPDINFLHTGNFSDPPALSPDGKWLVFGGPENYGTRSSKEGRELWLRALDSTTARPLAGTEGATLPFWSPDSRSIGYFANGKLNRIDAFGGPPIPLADARLARGATWGRDGTILFAPLTGHIYRVPASGGTSQPVTTLNASRQELEHESPQFLPDGRHFLFYVASMTAENDGTYVASLDGGEPKLIIRGGSDAVYAAPGYLLFVRQSQLIAQAFDASRLRLGGDAIPIADHVGINLTLARGIFTVSENSILCLTTPSPASTNSRLLWFDRNGKQIAETGRPAQYIQPSLSPDGRKLAIVILDAASQKPGVWVYDVARNTKKRLTFFPGINAEPAWSPDGKVIAFTSSRKGGLDLYEKAADGTGSATPLVVDSSNKFLPTWSPDGRYLLFQRRATRNSNIEIWALPLFGARKPFPVIQDSQFDASEPAVSPNGRWLAYVSDESGRNEVYVVPFLHASGEWLVSSDGGSTPRWRRDGKELFYISADKKLMSAQINNEQGASLSIGQIASLFEVRLPGLAGYDVSADGKKFVVVSADPEEASQPLTLVTNWPALLKKQQ